MKTVKTLKKVNVVFLCLILFMGIGTLISGKSGQADVSGLFKKDSSEVAQIYGDEPLVDIELAYNLDSASVKIYGDSDLLDVRQYDFIGDNEFTRVSHISPGDSAIFRFAPFTIMHVKTKRGVTSFMYFGGKEGVGYFVLNGKLHADFDQGGVSGQVDGNPAFFAKDFAWAYVKGRTPGQEMKANPEKYNIK